MPTGTQSSLLRQAITTIKNATDNQLDSFEEAAELASQSNFVNEIAKKTDLPDDEVKALVNAVLSFLFAAYQNSIQKDDRPKRFIEPLVDEFPDYCNEELLGRIAKILAIRPLAIRAKRNFLSRAHNTKLLSCAIVTDQRPVFGDDPEVGDHGVIIYENLNFTYLEAGRDVRTLSLACSIDDLKSLEQQIERARKKWEALAKTLKDSGRTVLNEIEEIQ
ncbi:MAG: hypothetical protein LBG99_07210 [Propionibacteriaceae bacterium]|jgi:hypothetical protein|nr:hypothetical protein [Propionibacteriaceae bacterium]